MTVPKLGTLDEIMAAQVYIETQAFPLATYPKFNSHVEEPEDIKNLKYPCVFRFPPRMSGQLYAAKSGYGGAEQKIKWEFEIVYLVGTRLPNSLGKLQTAAGHMMLPAFFAYVKNYDMRGSDGIATVQDTEFPHPFTMFSPTLGGVEVFGFTVVLHCLQFPHVPA